MAKRILWRWLRLALALEAALAAVTIYVAFRDHVVVYQDAETIRNFMALSVSAVAAAAVVASAEVLSDPEQ